jgi:hypothetical protein
MVASGVGMLRGPDWQPGLAKMKINASTCTATTAPKIWRIFMAIYEGGGWRFAI